MEYEYYVFDINKDRRAAVIKDISHGLKGKSYLLRRGVHCSEFFLPTKECVAHKTGGDMITDFINNISRCVVISERVKKVFEEEGLDNEKVEYLPFILKDKRGQKVPEQYYVANALTKVDCFDFEHAEHDLIGDLLEPDVIEILKDKIPEDATFFRLGEQPRYILIRSDLLDRLNKEEFTGIAVRPMGVDVT